MADPSASSAISAAFTQKYYEVLERYPAYLSKFYKDSSTLTLAQVGDDGRDYVETAAGVESIQQVSATVQGALVHRPLTIDSQISVGNGVVVQVTGVLRLKGVDRQFSQTFFLATQTNGYYVLNDLLRIHAAPRQPQPLENGFGSPAAPLFAEQHAAQDPIPSSHQYTAPAAAGPPTQPAAHAASTASAASPSVRPESDSSTAPGPVDPITAPPQSHSTASTSEPQAQQAPAAAPAPVAAAVPAAAAAVSRSPGPSLNPGISYAERVKSQAARAAKEAASHSAPAAASATGPSPQQQQPQQHRGGSSGRSRPDRGPSLAADHSGSTGGIASDAAAGVDDGTHEGGAEGEEGAERASREQHGGPPGGGGSRGGGEVAKGVYVKNLPQAEVTDQLLYDEFVKFGALEGGIQGITIVESPRFQKVAYIKFESLASSQAAQKADGMLLCGKRLIILPMLQEFIKGPPPYGGRGGRMGGVGGRYSGPPGQMGSFRSGRVPFLGGRGRSDGGGRGDGIGGGRGSYELSGRGRGYEGGRGGYEGGRGGGGERRDGAPRGGLSGGYSGGSRGGGGGRSLGRGLAGSGGSGSFSRKDSGGAHAQSSGGGAEAPPNSNGEASAATSAVPAAAAVGAQ